MSEIAISRCPICGAAATVIHMYDGYDRADFGWSCGCARFQVNDGVHGVNATDPLRLFPRVSGCLTKQAAIEAWNEKVKRMQEVMGRGNCGSYQHPPEADCEQYKERNRRQK